MSQHSRARSPPRDHPRRRNREYYYHEKKKVGSFLCIA